ncbi:ATP-dependent helicase [Patescibacteria group bacterium]|nr:ATP-dependent helicase [Patescibacteria group bacterium]MBU1663076.1 ATP-dependent helicase [Patescibacteria group bacterium]MBU1934240.1 ATP-dependent helicase [Patescibacteria group bacterium]MBU2008175.1 ATP-dependent helicase [Patescibacteria group bacterium]MBU2233262.1 ATP-dependent helicase [Patescibacteria group bacterium]
MNNLLENLNKEQLSAVLKKHGPLLIVAGAGTGKTTVITQRIAYLIEQGLAKSDEILALTFTEKAAAEMEDRVGLLLPIGYFDLWISTFHSFAERILKEHSLSIGLPGDFKLLNEFEQWALVKKNLDKFELNYYRPLGNPTKFIHALLKHFSRAKDEDISPAAYLEYADGLKQNLDRMLSGVSKLSLRAMSTGLVMTEGIAEQEVSRLNEIANAYHIYQQVLLYNNFLDFGDLINYTLKLFRERPAILEKYRKQFKYILVDEFQDTNWAQYELIKFLAAPANNLTVVGDDDQSIYKFRGASLSNILQFKKDFTKSEEIILVKNYRSAQNILDLSYEFIKQNNPNRLEWQLENQKIKTPLIPLLKEDKIGLRPCLQEHGGLSKKLIAENSGAGAIEVLQGADLAEEVKLVADKIVELKNKDKASSLNDFAVLVRANDSANNFMAEFDRRGLSYIFGALRGLYAKPLIMDVIAYFKLLDNYHESLALWRILNLPIFNFTYEELVNFNHLANKKAWSLYEVINSNSILKFSANLEKKLKPVLALISQHSVLAREKNVSEVFLAFMNDSGYLKYLTRLAESNIIDSSIIDSSLPIVAQNDKKIIIIEQKTLEAVSLLNQFLKRIKTFESSSNDKTVKAFLVELNLETEAGETGNLAPEIDAGPEAVKILTAHGAKGLEFKYVFIANLVDKRFPTIERSEQIELPDALVKEILPHGDVHLEEERRLFYVAMTRAKYGLYFSWARDYGGARDKKPSRFLQELSIIKNDKSTSSKNIVIAAHEPQSRKLLVVSDPGSLVHGEIHKAFHMASKPGMTVQTPSYFSYSQLAAYSACPYQYRFAHILKIPIHGKEQFSFGKTLHATLQKLFVLINEKKDMIQADLFNQPSCRIDSPLARRSRGVCFDEILQLYEQSWVDDWFESKKKKQERKKQGQEILKGFYEKYQANWPKVLFLEKGFNFKVAYNKDSYVVRGVVDRIDQVNDSLKLVDYKTGKPKDKLTFEDKEQLLIYQLAIQELFKQEIKTLAFYYLDNNSEVEFIGSAKDLEKIKAKIINTIKEIKQGCFKAKPGVLCAWCDYNSICEYGC